MKEKLNALNLLYPQKCGYCGKIYSKPICNLCEHRLQKITFPHRKVFLARNGIFYDEHMHIFKYTGIIKEKIKEYKFGNGGYLYEFFAEIIYRNSKIMKFLKKYDYIIPIPLHKYRYRNRGYNQTLLIAKKLEKLDKSLYVKNNILLKNKNIKPQSKLNKFERVNNIKNAYTIKNINEIKNKKIILFDDVFTTGNTTNECSRLLKRSGTKKVGILTIAKD